MAAMMLTWVLLGSADPVCAERLCPAGYPMRALGRCMCVERA